MMAALRQARYILRPRRLTAAAMLVVVIVIAVAAPLQPSAGGGITAAHVNAQNGGSQAADDSKVAGDGERVMKSCVNAGVTEGVSFDMKVCLAWAANSALQVSHWAAGVSGLLLQTSVDVTVVNMNEQLDRISAIDNAWTAIRDVMNIVFIFLLLYIAIMLIFRADTNQTKKLLLNVVLIALLINFSMFLTKFIIDVSNILAVEFYQGAVGETGIAKSLFHELRIQGLYHNEEPITLSNMAIVVKGIMGSILLWVVAFVMFAAAILFVIRFGVLILLIILSPAAFAAFILPQTRNIATKWWQRLLSEAFYAPAFFIMMAISINIITAYQNQMDAANLADAMSQNPANVEGAGVTFLNFLIFIFFFVATLIVSKQVGGTGAQTAINYGGKARQKATRFATGSALGAGAAATRGTVGRAASRVADSGMLKRQAAKGGLTGLATRQVLKGSKGVAGSSFDARNTGIGKSMGLKGNKKGFDERRADKIKKDKEFATKTLASSDSEKAREAGKVAKRQRKKQEQRARAEYEQTQSQGVHEQQQLARRKRRAQALRHFGNARQQRRAAAQIQQVEQRQKRLSQRETAARNRMERKQKGAKAVEKSTEGRRQAARVADRKKNIESRDRQLEYADTTQTAFDHRTKTTKTEAANAIRKEVNKKKEDRQHDDLKNTIAQIQQQSGQ